MGLRKETVKLSLITGISIVGGLLFHILLGRQFGISYTLDCFFIVLAILGWLNICNTFITALYIPIFNEVKAKGTKQESLIFAEVILKWVVIITVIVVAVVILFKGAIIKIIAPGFSRDKVLLSTQIIEIIIYSLLFSSISHVITLTLNALYYYTVPALTGLLDPLFNIIALFTVVPVLGIKGLACSYLIANFIRAVILLLYFWIKTGWKPTLLFYHKKLPELISKSSKMAANGFIWGMRDIITRSFASRMGEGAVALLSYAEKIINVLIQITINPLSRIFYARIAEWIPLSKWNDIRFLFARATRASFTVGLFISAGAVTFLPSFLHILFGESKFSGEDISTLITMFNILLVYFIVLLFEQYLTRMVYALKKVGVVTINASAGVMFLAVSAFLLWKLMGIYCLPLSISLSQIVVCCMYFYFTRNYLNLQASQILSRFKAPFLLSLCFALGGVLIKLVVNSHWMMIAVILPLWAGGYLLVAKRLLKTELEILFAE